MGGKTTFRSGRVLLWLGRDGVPESPGLGPWSHQCQFLFDSLAFLAVDFVL